MSSASSVSLSASTSASEATQDIAAAPAAASSSGESDSITSTDADEQPPRSTDTVNNRAHTVSGTEYSDEVDGQHSSNSSNNNNNNNNNGGDIEDDDDDGLRTARRKARLNYTERDDYDDDVAEPVDDAYSMEEAQAVEASNLPLFDMTVNELARFPQYRDNMDVYIELRNVIVHEWQKDVTRYLTFQRATQHLETRFRPQARPIFQWLDQYGFINSGCLPPTGKPSECVPLGSLRKRIIVIGAGASGLATARQLRSFGHTVTVIEARDRLGGRVCTDFTTFSGPVDLGASIITGLEGGNPIRILLKQIHRVRGVTEKESVFDDTLHYINSDTRVYGLTGQPIDPALDTHVDSTYNRALAGVVSLLDPEAGQRRDQDALLTPDEHRLLKLPDMSPTSDAALHLDLADGIMRVRERLGVQLTAEQEAVFQWFVANLEYGCATNLNRVSLLHWDQDDQFSFNGTHSMVRPGYGTIVARLAEGVDVLLKHRVREIAYGGEVAAPVVVTTVNEEEEEVTFEADAVVCSVSLGVLKSGIMRFSPPLPDWKQASIDKLGFGLLNKLVLEFPYTFWSDADTFGSVREHTDTRGRFYIFWNLERVMHKPVLVALITGDNAYDVEKEEERDLVTECMGILRRMCSSDDEVSVPDPVSFLRTKWHSDPYARGSYSFVAAGATGTDCDALAQPVGDTLFFAGEATCRTHPATVPGAYFSGLRAAGQVQDRFVKHLDVMPLSAAMTQRARERFEARKKELTPAMMADRINAFRHKRRGMRSAPTNDNLALFLKEAAAREKQAPKPAVAVEAVRAGLASLISKITRGESIEATPTLSDASEEKSTSLPIARGSLLVVQDTAMEESTDALDLPAVPMFDDFETKPGDGSHKSSRSKKEAHHRQHSSSSISSSSTSKRSHSGDHSSSLSAKRSKAAPSTTSTNGSSMTKKEVTTAIYTYIRRLIASRSHAALFREFACAANHDAIKSVAKKATAKVLEDWQSKPRTVSLDTWLAGKRTASILELLKKYFAKRDSESSQQARSNNGNAGDGDHGDEEGVVSPMTE